MSKEKLAVVSIRINNRLKDQLSEIAKKKDTSLNDVTSTVLAEFVENYELEQVKDDEIPSAEQIKKNIKKNNDEMLKNFKEQIKVILFNMAKRSETSVYTTLFSDSDIKPELLTDIIQKVKQDLSSLGYHTFVFTEHMDPDYSESQSPEFMPNDMVISLEKDIISYWSEFEKNYAGIPF